MAGRGDNNKSGSAGRGASHQSGQGKNQADRPRKENASEPRPSRTSNQGRKESSGGDLSRKPEKGQISEEKM